MNQKLPITGVLMTGGESRRMGTDKAFLEIEGKPLIVRTIDLLNQTCQEVFISCAKPEQYAQYGKAVVDRVQGKGPLGGLYSVMSVAKQEVVFITACDMPSIRVEGIQLLYGEIGDSDILVPYARGKMHPLHAFYHRRILPLVEQYLLTDRLKLLDLLNACRTKILEVDHIFGNTHILKDYYFLNANTPQDWEEVMKINSPK